MARIRTIKPSFFRDHDMAALSLTARLTFIGLWTYVDDEGRGVDDARLVKGDLWQLDDKHTVRKVEADLQALADAGRIERYTAGGKRYLRVIRWKEHQRINRPTESIIPPSLSERSGRTPGPGGEGSRGERNGKEIEEGSVVGGSCSEPDTTLPTETVELGKAALRLLRQEQEAEAS